MDSAWVMGTEGIRPGEGTDLGALQFCGAQTLLELGGPKFVRAKGWRQRQASPWSSHPPALPLLLSHSKGHCDQPKAVSAKSAPKTFPTFCQVAG